MYYEDIREIHQIMLALESEPSKLSKLDILNEHRNNALLKELIFLACSPRHNFYIKQLPNFGSSITTQLHYDMSLIDVIKLFKTDVTSVGLRGNASYNALLEYMPSMPPEMLDIFQRVILKNLRIGATTKTFNKIWGDDFIPEVPCIKARENSVKNLANISYPAYSQTKYDGTRLIAQWSAKLGKMVLQTRNGSLFYDIDAVHEDASSLMSNSILNDGFGHASFIDGELVFADATTGVLLNRKQSNGLASKSIKGTLTASDKQKYDPIYLAWDLVNSDNPTRPYCNRLDALASYVDVYPSIQIAETTEVFSLDEANALFEAARANGEEGTILKNKKAPWENTRSKHLVKFKEFNEIDLRIIDINSGGQGTKNANTLGSIVCATDDGMIKTSVTFLVSDVSGFSEEDRIAYWEDPDLVLGKIVTVKYNELILGKNSDVWSLFLPTLVEVRHDKDTTNTFEEVKK